MPEPAVKRMAGAIHCLFLWLIGIESSGKNEFPKVFTWKERHISSTSLYLSVGFMMVMLKFNCNDKPLKNQMD